MKHRDFVNILLNEWAELEAIVGKRITETEFAKHLTISQPLLSTWLAGNTKPNEGKIRILAEKLGHEIYDSFGIIRPDPHLQAIQAIWEKIPLDKQVQLVEDSRQYAQKTVKNEKPKKVSKKQKVRKNTK